MKYNILITGAASGFGRLSTISLLKNGYTVFATLRDMGSRRAEAADSLRNDASGLPGELHIYEMDVTDDSSVTSAVSSVLDSHGNIDVVVNNAGMFGAGINEVFGLEQLQKLMDVNVYGGIRVNNAVLPTMRKQKSGLLVQVTSTTACYSLPTCASYIATKAAAERIAEGNRYELSPLGIDSVILQPGAYPTEIMEKLMPPAHPELMSEYASAAPYIEKFSQNYRDYAFSEPPPDPQFVADTLVRLIETPAGERPLRTVADAKVPHLAEAVNSALSEIQQKIMTDLDIAELSQVQTD